MGPLNNDIRPHAHTNTHTHTRIYMELKELIKESISAETSSQKLKNIYMNICGT